LSHPAILAKTLRGALGSPSVNVAAVRDLQIEWIPLHEQSAQVLASPHTQADHRQIDAIIGALHRRITRWCKGKCAASDGSILEKCATSGLRNLGHDICSLVRIA
jgi:hypothetical protein